MRAGYWVVAALAGMLLVSTRPAWPQRLPATPPAGGVAAPAPSLAVIRPAPDFALLDPAGRRVRLADFRGRVVLLAFVYTSCPAACPLITQRMAALHRRLAGAGLLPSRAALLSVTVDPERDDPAALRRHARTVGADPESWPFLRETPDRLRPVLAAWDEWTRALPGGEIDHPARLYLIDAQGRIREIYSLALFDERQAFLDIRALLREPSS
jgi:protein SCO1/2